MLIWLNCLFYPTLYPSHVHVCQQCIVREGGLGLWFGLENKDKGTTKPLRVMSKFAIKGLVVPLIFF